MCFYAGDMAVMRIVTPILALLLCLTPLEGATLEKLSLEEMIGKSTGIVRGRIASAGTVRRGSLIYTVSEVEVLERWKGPEGAACQVAVPGGKHGGYQQTFSGAPELAAGAEYVLFLWTGKSGLTQVIGLSQGLFTLSKNGDGTITAHRAASGEVMLNPRTGQQVDDVAMSFSLNELRDRVESSLNTARK